MNHAHRRRSRADILAQKLADSYKAHKVHLGWASVLASRYGGMIKAAKDPKLVLLTIISTDLTIAALGLPPDDLLAQALLNCSAFAFEIGIAGGAIVGSSGLATAMIVSGLLSSGYTCLSSLQPFFQGMAVEQQQLEASRAESTDPESEAGPASGPSGQGGADHFDRGRPPGGHPASGSPTKSSPAKSSPAKSSPGKSSPGRSSPGRSSPGRSSPGGGPQHVTGLEGWQGFEGNASQPSRRGNSARGNAL